MMGLRGVAGILIGDTCVPPSLVVHLEVQMSDNLGGTKFFFIHQHLNAKCSSRRKLESHSTTSHDVIQVLKTCMLSHKMF